jgi:hypothetical protein
MREDKEIGCLEDTFEKKEPIHRIYERDIPKCYDSRECLYKTEINKEYNICLYEFRE